MTVQELTLYALIILLGSGIVSYLFSLMSWRLAIQHQALDVPKKERKIQKEPIPLWGGLGIGLTILIGILILASVSQLFMGRISLTQILGFVFGLIVLIIGGLLDDRFELKAWQIFLFPLTAAMVVVASGTSIVHITHPLTSAAWFLDWWCLDFGSWSLSFPGDLLTVAWMLVAIFATKLTDGLDGLVSGIAIIGASMVGLLSAMPTFYQPSTTLLASSIAGAYIGFLPHNKFPAKQYLGEGGSTMAGYCLGFLAIVSSAKIAIALAVLAIPLADIAFVVLRRMREHRPWFKGDATHLHFRLLAAGLPHKRAVHLFWLISASAGFAALFLQTRGKIFLVFILVILTLLLSWIADRAIQRRLPTSARDSSTNQSI